MKKLSLLFAFVGFFAFTNLSAQTAKCTPASIEACQKKASCTPAQVAQCKKVAASCLTANKPSCQKSTATAKTVANKKAKSNTCCGIPIPAGCCETLMGKAKETSKLAMKEE